MNWVEALLLAAVLYGAVALGCSAVWKSFTLGALWPAVLLWMLVGNVQ